MITRSVLKTTSILFFAASFLLGSIFVPALTNVRAVATNQPGYTLQVRNVTDSGTFDGAAKSIDLGAGEVAQMRMQVGNLEVGNDINTLRFKSFFTDTVNPTEFHADIKADSLAWIGGSVNISVPNGYYLEYVPGSTVYDVDDRPELTTRTQVPDINGTSPLAFNDGYALTNVTGGEHTWIWVYFKVKATQTQPIVINPRLDLTKFVANTTKGEALTEKKTETTATPGDTLIVQMVVKNGVDQSTLHNVVLKDQKPFGNTTPQNLTATVTSTEATTSKFIKINITESQEINVISGSVVLKDLSGNVLKTLTETEVNQLFGAGFALGDIAGTFEFAKVVEFKVRVSQVLPTPPLTELPDTGPGTTLAAVLSMIPVGWFLRRLKKSI